MDEWRDDECVCRYAYAWLYSVIGVDVEVTYTAIAWGLTAPSLQQQIIDGLDADVYIDDLVNSLPSEHGQWDAYGERIMSALHALLPGTYHGMPMYALPHDQPRRPVAGQTVMLPVAIGTANAATGWPARAAFGVVMEWDGEDWRVVDVRLDVPTGLRLGRHTDASITGTHRTETGTVYKVTRVKGGRSSEG